MDYVTSEWLNLALRWLHVVSAIFWIGQTALFAWLDHRMSIASSEGEDAVFMVHSGGFYRVEKRPVTPPLPSRIEWFKWEAALTWASGIGLLVLVYYLGGALVPYDDGFGDGGLTPAAGIAISLGLMIAGWVIYDLLWQSPLAEREVVATAISLGLLALAAWGTAQVFTGRGAYIQVGAMLGTIMAANVWIRILPPQRRMIAMAAAGEVGDPGLGERAKYRSRHNTFLALPLILIMISNHFPVTTYGHRLNWVMLIAIFVVGFVLRAAMNRHERRA